MIRALSGPELVMLYLVFGNEDARAEIMARIESERAFDEQMGRAKPRRISRGKRTINTAIAMSERAMGA
jgi:hypothetical protein